VTDPDKKTDADVTIVGTAHVSERSAREARETIRDEDPDYVAVELDPRRFDSVRDRDDEGYGGDMAAAVDEAERLGIPVVLIDRDVRSTVRRFWRELPILERLKTVGALIASLFGFGGADPEELERAIERGEASRYVDELREFSPTGARVLIDERDAYMAGRLLELDGTVVAVVGAGHRQGIRGYLDNPDEIPEAPDEGSVEPDYDIHSDGDTLVVTVDLPGYASEDIDLSLSGRRLELDASRPRVADPKFRFVGDRRPSEAELTVRLPADVSTDGATATCDDGVLRVVRLGCRALALTPAGRA